MRSSSRPTEPFRPTAGVAVTVSNSNAPRLRAAVRSDVGLVRDHNEDRAFADHERGLFMVADGVGGHAAGEVASAIAVHVVRIALEEARAELSLLAVAGRGHRQRAGALLADAVRSAHQAVRQVAQCEPDKQGMGTTLDVALVVGDELFVAHVGDSRTYLVRNGRVTQLTRDHTMAEHMAAHGSLGFDEISTSPLRSVLVNAVGVGPSVSVDVTSLPIRGGDRVLLCSDGLHEHATSDLLLSHLDAEPDAAVDALIALARAGGGRDNITGVVVEVIGARAAQDASAAA